MSSKVSSRKVTLSPMPTGSGFPRQATFSGRGSFAAEMLQEQAHEEKAVVSPIIGSEGSARLIFRAR
jgi:hypothetical protein